MAQPTNFSAGDDDRHSSTTIPAMLWQQLGGGHDSETLSSPGGSREGTHDTRGVTVYVTGDDEIAHLREENQRLREGCDTLWHENEYLRYENNCRWEENEALHAAEGHNLAVIRSLGAENISLQDQNTDLREENTNLRDENLGRWEENEVLHYNEEHHLAILRWYLVVLAMTIGLAVVIEQEDVAKKTTALDQLCELRYENTKLWAENNRVGEALGATRTENELLQSKLREQEEAHDQEVEEIEARIAELTAALKCEQVRDSFRAAGASMAARIEQPRSPLQSPPLARRCCD
ncbi:Uu.00g052020.m01.CDS01 [Anthostomella pinea]|uniref:Uu.00g052020.m01.CDS01 n=1 Tax=Anthostomella pinea TaxID=933095 RepID=A0AAI8VW45_9PEZI|nr:Uu.00g052020.m01.CDS01 [Anthostomella pinea]